MLSWNELVDSAGAIASKIRNANPNSILLFSGIGFGRDFSELTKRPFPYKNTIYMITDHSWADEIEAIKIKLIL